ncbi:hypothetical protein EZI54_05200 [Marinobacter halodurans]|uniref:Toxin CptA n=1 Tax=Marinobacter halodurans TaxID=2528979 RepID=A0ABY1ZQK0_9GAMM|nr:hypothetical protein [Marinobacter halodurans]TBW57852.1 hypothetical protein EZI54_05200 [Marinobacter halodurans]
MYNRIDLSLQRSTPLALILALSWAIPTGCVLALPATPAAGQLIASLTLLWIGWGSVRRLALLRGPKGVTGLSLRRQQLTIRDATGLEVRVAVAGNSRLTSRLALLKLRPWDSTLGEYTVLLVHLPFCTNVDPDAFRRLRVWLRFSGSPSSSLNQPV